MDYKLAKSLKDAGFDPEFKQTRENTYSYLDRNGNPCGVMGKDAAYIPTLEELIEACGDAICCLDFGNVCRAESFEENKIGEGETPKEAVARLYIALNKK